MAASTGVGLQLVNTHTKHRYCRHRCRRGMYWIRIRMTWISQSLRLLGRLRGNTAGLLENCSARIGGESAAVCEIVDNGLKNIRFYNSKYWDPDKYVSLSNIADNPGATKKPKRVGRGIGSGRGKTCGKGHKGQKARSGRKPKLGFEGGQTPISQRFPKKGFYRHNTVEWTPVTLNRLKLCVLEGRLDTSQVVTMKDLRDTGTIGKKIPHGVKVLATGAQSFDVPLHLQVTKCDPHAKSAIENAGGSVTEVYYNKLGLRALLKPEVFAKKGRLLPRPVHYVPPKYTHAYDMVGQLPPVKTLPNSPPSPPKSVEAHA